MLGLVLLLVYLTSRAKAAPPFQVKIGVSLEGVDPRLGLDTIARVWYETTGERPVFTSSTDDAPGRVNTSLHPSGLAVDIRSVGVTQIQVSTFRSKLVALSSYYQVIPETDHIHVELDLPEF